MALVGSYILSVLPGQTVAPLFSWSDKLNHAGAFLVLAFLLMYGWRLPWWRGSIYLLGYGVFIEFSQLFAIHRSAELADVAADGVGIILGLSMYAIYRFL